MMKILIVDDKVIARKAGEFIEVNKMEVITVVITIRDVNIDMSK